MGNYLDKDGLTRFKEKMLTEVDKRITSGGGGSDDVPTKEEIIEGANRVTDVETSLELTTLEALQTAIASLEARLEAEAIPVGTVIAMSTNSAPSGYILCDGSAVSRTTYANLFAVIGTTYGGGNGSTTFNVPNLVDRFIQGSDTVGVVKEAGLPNITGKIGQFDAWGYGATAVRVADGAFNFEGSKTNHGRAVSVVSNTAGDDYRQAKFDASRSNAIYGKSDTVQPPSLTMRYYIKY